MNLKTLTAKLLSLRRFSLRTFLFLVLLAGCGFGLFSRWHRGVVSTGEAQLRILANSNAVYEGEINPSWFTKLVRRTIHSEYQRRFMRVTFTSDMADQLELANDFANSDGVSEVSFCFALKVSPEFSNRFFCSRGIRKVHLLDFYMSPEESELFFRAMRQSTELDTLIVGNGCVTERAAIEIGQQSKLKSLDIASCTPEALPLLANNVSLINLRIRAICNSEDNDPNEGESEASRKVGTQLARQQTFNALAQNQHFSSLQIDGPLGLTREDLVDFCQTSKIKTLELQSPENAPECLEEFAKLRGLESLTIYDLAIQDKHLPPLANAKNLKQLTIGPNVTSEGIRTLRKQLPGCKIERF